MIVIGTDTHKQTHTCGAVFAGSAQIAGELTAAAREARFRELLAWGRDLDEERIWALEDCRHVSGSFERFLVAQGERVVRVPPKLMGQSRRGERTRGKSDAIDALAVARAALREGPETRERTRRASELEREIAAMVRTQAPQLLELPGCGSLTAAKLLAETAGAERFASDADLSMSNPVNPQRGSLTPQIAAVA